MFLLVPVVLLLLVPGCCGLWTVDRLTVRGGGSVTVPCHYNSRFREQVKYWCRGKSWYTCVRVRPSAKVSITDSPAEQVTTLTLTGLQLRDAGRYWCAIKRRGLTNDIRTSLELQVTTDTPDLWVSSSAVSGPEGGNVTVRCYYSDRLKDDEKKWCRSGDLHSCQSQQDIQPSQNAPLQLVDEGTGVFTVTLLGLQAGAGGWYWCMTGGVQAPVHITVTTASTTLNYTESPERTSSPHQSPPAGTSPVSTRTPLTSHPPTAPSPEHSPDRMTTTSSTSFSPSISSSPSSTSSTIFSPSISSSPSSTSSTLTALTTRPGTEPKDGGAPHTPTGHRLYLYLIVAGVTVLAVAVVVSLFWRRRTQRRLSGGSHMTLEGAEPEELSVNDDVDLLDHEWMNRTVLKLEEETNAASFQY